MSYGSTAAVTAATAGAAAAAKRRQEQKEEEKMTQYSPEELAEDWEFKIVRSSTEAFGKPETLRQVIAEEARAGWVLVEKFDNSRLRFKRPVSARAQDTLLPPEVDPYRTQVGTSAGVLVLALMGGLTALLLLGVLVMFLLIG